MPGKIDIFPGADVLEEVMLDIRIKDKVVVIRECLLGWISLLVSEPVQKPESENTFPTLAKTSLIAPLSTEDLISKFWELKSVHVRKHLSNEEKEM